MFLAKKKNTTWELNKEQLDEKFVYNYKPEVKKYLQKKTLVKTL